MTRRKSPAPAGPTVAPIARDPDFYVDAAVRKVSRVLSAAADDVLAAVAGMSPEQRARVMGRIPDGTTHALLDVLQLLSPKPAPKPPPRPPLRLVRKVTP